MTGPRAHATTVLRGGGRHLLRVLGDPPQVEKRGDPGALRREAHALRALEGRDVAPAMTGSGRGLVRMTLLPGRPRRLARVPASAAEALGRVLRRAHEARRSGRASLPGSPGRPSTLASYLRRRAAQAEDAAGGEGIRIPTPVLRGGADPFRLLHGDLVEENVVWTPGGPMLVDWEFSRTGDPAEDLAYLAEVNVLPPRVLSAVLRGYGEGDVAARVGAWRPVVALEAGAWYLRHGEPGRGAALVDRARRLL